jgi:transposase
MKVYIGVDLHKTQFTVYGKAAGEAGVFKRFSTHESGYAAFEHQVSEAIRDGHEVHIAVETMGNARYFMHRLERTGARVVVVNTLKFKVITESVKKTDRRDASTLAEFLEKDMLPEARLCSQASEELRRLLKTRKTLVETIGSIKNQIHALLLSMGIESKRGELQSMKERRRVKSVLAAHQLAGEAIESLFDTIDNLSREVKRYEQLIEAYVADDPMVAIIRTLPGAGLITGSTIRAYIDDISRFVSPGQLAAYAGLVPWVQHSNEVRHYGKTTKRGPKELRTALVQVVLGMVRMKRITGEYRIMLRYDRLKQVKGSGKSIIATARTLAEILWHMLTYNEPFDEARMKDPKLYKKSLEMQATAYGAA